MSEYTIYGNYDTQELNKFPLDCEGMATVQNNIKLLATIALLSGVDKLILTGCTVSGSQRTAGYVYIRTGSNLIGEILYHPQQNNSTTCYIKEENISITVNNETFSNAYTKRYLASGIGSSSMNWSSFVSVSDIGNNALKTSLNTLSNTVSGHTSNISSLQSTVSGHTSSLNSLQSTVSEHTSSLETIPTHLYQHTYVLYLTDNFQPLDFYTIAISIVSKYSAPLTDISLYNLTHGKILPATGVNNPYYAEFLSNQCLKLYMSDQGSLYNTIFNWSIRTCSIIQIY